MVNGVNTITGHLSFYHYLTEKHSDKECLHVAQLAQMLVLSEAIRVSGKLISCPL